MTEEIKKPTARVAFPLFSILALLLLLFQSEIVIERMNDGLRLCVTSIVPTLFPFMVLSELIVLCGAIRPLGKLLARPCRALFGIGEQSACVLLLGWLCGFPIGTRGAVRLYKQGVIDTDELSHLLCFVNLPSSAFLISTVGSSLMGDRRFGLALSAITLTSALLLGISGKHLRHKKKTQTLSASFLKISVQGASSPDGIRAFSEAVSSSALAMLRICAFVVFFGVLVGVLESFDCVQALPTELRALLFGLFEMTGGTAKAATLPDPLHAEALCMLLVGWSGISVHCQMISLCSDISLSYRPYLLAKAAHGLLNVLLWWGARQLFF